MTPTPAQQAWLNHLTDTLRYRPVRPRTEAEAAVTRPGTRFADPFSPTLTECMDAFADAWYDDLLRVIYAHVPSYRPSFSFDYAAADPFAKPLYRESGS